MTLNGVGGPTMLMCGRVHADGDEVECGGVHDVGEVGWVGGLTTLMCVSVHADGNEVR